MSLDTSKVKFVNLVIYQPNSPSEGSPAKDWSCTVEDLKAFAEEAKKAVAKCEEAIEYSAPKYLYSDGLSWERDYLHPSEKSCQWCKAKASCPAIATECLQGLPDLTNDICVTSEPDFVSGIETAISNVRELPLATLSKLAKVKGLFKQWQDAIDDRLFEELSAGNEVPDFKLVQGRGGNRKWKDEDDVESAMKSMRLKLEEMYTKKVISPSSAEKLLAKSRPKLWNKLKDKIERSEGSPQIAPITDKRPAIDVRETALEGLEDLTEQDFELSLDDFEI